MVLTESSMMQLGKEVAALMHREKPTLTERTTLP